MLWMAKLSTLLLRIARAVLLGLGDRGGKRVPSCSSGTADTLGSPHLLLTTHTLLERAEILPMSGRL